MSRWILLALVLAVVLFGCKTAEPRTPAIQRRLAIVDDGYHAGAARVDITPPIHLGMFGHGPEGRIATGVRLRLRCSAFVIAQQSEAIALVPCDLAAPSLILQRAIVDRLHANGIALEANRVFLMATHTHAGPAHYFEARRYSGPFSTYAPGFDREVVDYLAERIAEGIVAAFTDLRPACLSWRKDSLEGVTINRAYAAFVRNPPAPPPPDVTKSQNAAVQAQINEKQTHTQASGPPPAVGAVDTEIDVLRIDERAAGRLSCDASSSPRAVFAVFGMHNTAVPNTNELYHGDVFGFAVRTAESCMASDQGDQLNFTTCESSPPSESAVVVGIANGIEGDVSPRVAYQSVTEARRLGRELAKKIIALVRDSSCYPLEARGTLRVASWDLRWPSAIAVTRAPNGSIERVALCDEGLVGSAAAGGARDGPTRFRVFPEANAGYRLAEPQGCHGVKLPLTGGFGSDKDYDVPHTGTIAMVLLGRGVLATAPGEMTTTTGQRIREELRKILSVDAQNEPLARTCSTHRPPAAEHEEPASYTPMPIVGLTNSYLQYFATEDEYKLQLYEGASTLYGPNTARFLVYRFGCLAAHVATRPSPLPCDVEETIPFIARQPKIDEVVMPSFRPAPEVHRLEHDDPGYRSRSRAGLHVDTERRLTNGDGDRVWEVHVEALPAALLADRTRFRVEIKSGDLVLDDDRGSSIEIAEVNGGSSWRIRWQPLLTNNPACKPGTKLRFVLSGRVNLQSNEFTCDVP
jgi:neutral ceramidase